MNFFLVEASYLPSSTSTTVHNLFSVHSASPWPFSTVKRFPLLNKIHCKLVLNLKYQNSYDFTYPLNMFAIRNARIKILFSHPQQFGVDINYRLNFSSSIHISHKTNACVFSSFSSLKMFSWARFRFLRSEGNARVRSFSTVCHFTRDSLLCFKRKRTRALFVH